jgi:2-polyprenyl-3-methyl-5-hydroxy-6-metoxy-1,4-benzoquinol methylase
MGADPAQALADRLRQAALGFFDLHAVDIGLRLGLYEALAAGAASPGEVAAATGTNERYVREWLEQQAATGILAVDDVDAAPGARRFSLPAGHDEALLDPDSLLYAAPTARAAVAGARPLPQLLDAFRTGGGVPYAAYERDFHQAQADSNRATFLRLLGSEWLPAIPDVHARLRAEPPARVADVACGAAWSSVAIARAYPSVTVDAFDLDESSLELAQANVDAAALDDRITLRLGDAADSALDGRYDLVTVFEAIHDMARPVEALRALGRVLADGGAVLVVDERTEERFTAPAGERERYHYGWSILHCLAVGMVEQPSAATGTVMRPATFERYAREAGFGGVEVLPIEHDAFRFYLLHP